jgi:hypothetical protein
VAEKKQEVLVIQGRLDRSGRFTPRRCRSTYYVREWPVVEDAEYVVETLDREDRPLHREPALVTPDIDCGPGDPERFRLVAYIGLQDEAASARLRRGDLVLWRTEIPAAPKVRVSIGRAQPNRKRSYPLDLRYSEPGEGAHLTVVYQWGERQFRPIYIGPPAESIKIDLRELPGGDACRFVVMYSNGLRSVGDATRTFRLPRVGPSVAIARPERGETVVARTPVILEGHVSDPERPGGPRPDEDLVWLVDSEPVASGPIASIDGLPDGRHRITLSYRADPGAEQSVNVRARAAKDGTADDWDEWDPTDDDFGWRRKPRSTDQHESE